VDTIKMDHKQNVRVWYGLNNSGHDVIALKIVINFVFLESNAF
jgi:hypothetical protein